MAKGFISSYGEEEEESAVARLSKYNSLRPIYGLNILNFVYHKDGRIADSVVTYVLKNDKYDLTLKDEQNGRDLWTLIFFELPKVGEDAPEILKHWRNLFLTGKVSEGAPQYLQQAARIIAFENMSEEERQMIINFNDREAIRHAERHYDLRVARSEERNKIAVNLLNLGISHEQIEKATGLSLKEIQGLELSLKRQA